MIDAYAYEVGRVLLSVVTFVGVYMAVKAIGANWVDHGR